MLDVSVKISPEHKQMVENNAIAEKRTLKAWLEMAIEHYDKVCKEHAQIVMASYQNRMQLENK